MDSSEGYKRLKNEFNNLNSKPNLFLGLTVGLFNDDDFYRWRFTFQGPYDSPYISGIFLLELTFPKDYPNNAPQIHFLTPIYHLNVSSYKDSLGFVYPSFIKNWNPSITPENIFNKLFALFYKVNPDSAFDKEMANEYLNNRPLYESKIQYFTKKYASLGKYEIYKDWNFSCNESDLRTYSDYRNNSEIYNKYDGNEQSFNVVFFINGNSEKVSIQCQLKEKMKDVFNRFLGKYQYKFKGELLVMDIKKKKLNMNYQVGYIRDYWIEILVIDISDLKFLK